MSNNDEVIVSDRDFWVMGISFLMLALSVGVLIVCLVVLFGQAQKADETYAAACSYYQNLRDQEQSSEKYLRLHPDGAPALGLTAAQIQQSIDKEQAAVNSLSGLHCLKP